MITDSKSGIFTLVATITSVVVLALTATLTTITHDYTVYPEAYYAIGGRSDVVVLFLTSCIAVTIGGVLIATSFAEDSTIILKTKYFEATQFILFCLYLSSSIAVLANLYSIPQVPGIDTVEEVKNRAISAGVFGLVSGILHVIAMQAHRIFRDTNEESIRIVQ